MAVMCKPSEQDVFAQIKGCAPILQAFIECSTELQQHAKEMLKVLLDPETSEDDRHLAASTVADILFPNMHEGDKMLGMDLQKAEQLARENPESGPALEEMDREEATFAERLESIMRDRKITQTELANRIGIGQSAIAMMLKRECRPQKRTVARLAEALSVKPEELWPSFDGGVVVRSSHD